MKFEDIDFSAVQYRTVRDLIPFREYKTQYILFALLVVLSLAFRFPYPAIIIGLAYFPSEIVKKKKQVWQKFAQANGWQVIGSFDAPVPPSIDGVGSRKKRHNVVAGNVYGSNFRLFEYEYTIGSGKDRQVFRNTVMSFELKNNFTHILLDSKNNQGGARLVRKSAERLSLEGNFDEFFSLYVDPKHRVDALSIISPDVMQTIMRANKSYDIEIIGPTVYLFAEGDRRNKYHIKDLFRGAKKILDELNHRAKSFSMTHAQDTHMDMRSINKLDLRFAGGGHFFAFAVLILLFVVASIAAIIAALISQ